MKTQITSKKATEISIYFDIEHEGETYPFQAVLIPNYNHCYEVKFVESLGLNWNNLPEEIMDEAHEFSLKQKNEMQLQEPVIN